VVDDASANSQSIREVCNRHGAQLVVNKTNLGPGGARNRGLAEVNTEFVAFIDSDCIAEASAIAVRVADPRGRAPSATIPGGASPQNARLTHGVG
jgi:glycosyltransferase involved in cell wall biosynthesis